MKKVFMLLLLLTIIIFPATTFASTYFDAGASDPSTIWVYGTETWSQAGYWDLTTDTQIPDTAVVDMVNEGYNICYNCGMNYTDTHVGLFNSAGQGYYVESSWWYIIFVGEKVKQKWSTQFWVENQLVGSRGYIQPVLSFRWVDSTTGTAGVTTLNADGTAKTETIKIKESAEQVNSSDAGSYQEPIN